MSKVAGKFMKKSHQIAFFLSSSTHGLATLTSMDDGGDGCCLRYTEISFKYPPRCGCYWFVCNALVHCIIQHDRFYNP